ncbi:MAG: hypothetical protein ABIP93_19530 [Gemmatimonadaceae bacterium]
MPRFPQRRLILLPFLMCACHGWRTVSLEPNRSGALPRHSWVLLVSGERMSVEGGRFTQDSVIGMAAGGRRFAAPRDSVALVEERRVSAVRTLGLAAGLYGAVALIALQVFGRP